jgi:hypothetical protein
MGMDQRRTILVAAAVVLAVAGISWSRTTPAPGATCDRAFVAAYFYPGPDWIRAIVSRPPPSMMILDPTKTGAGDAPDPNYQAVVRQAEAAGITILGYSDTNYGRRPAAAVAADVRNYESWYHVTSIFLDRARSDSGGLAYYRGLSDYIHGENPGSTVMLNPGTYPDERYMSVADIVMVFEGTYSRYLSLRVPTWTDRYPAAKFAHAIYATPGSLVERVIAMAQHRHSGYTYVTDGSGPNPYRSLPAYWPQENAIIAGGCPVAGQPPTGSHRTS